MTPGGGVTEPGIEPGIQLSVGCGGVEATDDRDASGNLGTAGADTDTAGEVEVVTGTAGATREEGLCHRPGDSIICGAAAPGADIEEPGPTKSMEPAGRSGEPPTEEARSAEPALYAIFGVSLDKLGGRILGVAGLRVLGDSRGQPTGTAGACNE